MTSQPTEAPDPFGDESSPAISFNNAAIGTTYTGVVTGLPKMVQSRDFATKEPATWPDGNPKMAVVVNVQIDGEGFSVWASKPSSLYSAIGDAQRAAGERIKIGGTLSVRLIGEKPTSASPQKLYAAKYVPPVQTVGNDGWGGLDTPAAAAPAAPTPVATLAEPAAAAAPWDAAPSAQPAATAGDVPW